MVVQPVLSWSHSSKMLLTQTHTCCNPGCPSCGAGPGTGKLSLQQPKVAKIHGGALGGRLPHRSSVGGTLPGRGGKRRKQQQMMYPGGGSLSSWSHFNIQGARISVSSGERKHPLHSQRNSVAESRGLGKAAFQSLALFGWFLLPLQHTPPTS